jgi:hypothetical protein
VRWYLAGLLALGAPPALAAQSAGPMPMTLKITPNRAPVGGRVALAGTTAADGKRMTAQLRITLPDGSLRTIPAPLAATGDYSVAFSATTAPGLYRVTAIAPDGAAGDTASFKVLTTPQAADDATLEWQNLQVAEDSALSVVGRLLDTLPASPAKDSAEQLVGRLKQRMARHAADLAQFKQALGAITQMQAKYPAAAPALDPVVSELAAWTQQSETERVALNQELIQSAKESITCEQINAASEGIKVASALFNLAGTAVSVVGSFFKDWLADKVQSVLPPTLKNNAAFSLATAQIVKNGKASSDALVDYGLGKKAAAAGSGLAMIPGVLFDLAGMFTGKLFDRYCDKFEGPFDADLHVEFSNAAGTVWWTYDITIQGKLTVRYGKGATNAAKVKGEFVGSATHYGMWEDALRSFNPKLMNGAVVYKKTIMPVSMPFVDTEGNYAGALGPSAFFVPVDGTLIDRKLSIHVDKARTDFEGATAKVIWVVASPLSLVPVVLTNGFPYQGAYTVLRGGLTGLFGSAASDPTAGLTAFTVKNAGPVLLVDQTVRQDKIKGNGFEVSTRVHVKACNPSCP